MKVSGFTFVRNVLKYDYPVVESTRSILPVLDEFIVNVGRCDDGTLELICSISDPKIKIVESVWDETLRKDGLIYANKPTLRCHTVPAIGRSTFKPTKSCTKTICRSSRRRCGASSAILR